MFLIFRAAEFPARRTIRHTITVQVSKFTLNRHALQHNNKSSSSAFAASKLLLPPHYNRHRRHYYYDVCAVQSAAAAALLQERAGPLNSREPARPACQHCGVNSL